MAKTNTRNGTGTTEKFVNQTNGHTASVKINGAKTLKKDSSPMTEEMRSERRRKAALASFSAAYDNHNKNR